ncbi:cadherin domain-containing protein [Synechocystis sp. PCC 7339]|uniref:cadherin domain-containing protein n=1 Tax=Synechocystis sp. PCC 7339 TaxID=2782213 RepID=UPI001CBE2469|nr:cadherin domain-containing protein [Synechocystis sp. PCC 7339]
MLLEEIGHAIDARLNLADSPGDEGEIFANVVSGIAFDELGLQSLRSQADHFTIFVDGNAVPVEAATFSASNTSPITIPVNLNPPNIVPSSSGKADPYPSTINVTGVSGTITDITVTLKGLTHTFPADIDILLVGPTGAKTILMSDIGGGSDISGVNLSFSNTATESLPDDGSIIISDTYLPSNVGTGDTFDAPAPAPDGSYPVSFDSFMNTNPNGNWSLYIVDDNGSSSGSLSGGWTIEILTTNDDTIPPIITSGNVAKTINENIGLNQVIYQVTATDNGAVTFSLKSDVGDFSAFTINSITGEVRLTGNPNFENQSKYSFSVVATDAAKNSSEQVVNLNINNLDEVAPTITSGNTAKAIAENSGAGQIIYQTKADDSANISAGVIFGLKAGNDASLFTINPTTGEVKLIGNPDFETQSSYKFTVTASDSINPATEQLVNLTINKLDEVAPTITSGNTATPIDENSGAGQVIYQVTAIDDADISAGVTFGLKPGDDASSFTINPTTGEVTLSDNPNFETQSSYKLTVTASDGVNPATEQQITLAITDDNIAVVENDFFFAQFLDGTRQALLFQNQPFSIGQSGNWEILDTETIDSFNQVLWYNKATEEVGIWLTDNNWNWISSDTWQVKLSRTFNTELLFGTDINGDSLIGDQYTVVENQGGVSLLEGIFGAYYVQPGDDLVTPIKFLGEPFENQFGSWQALAAERIENINRVLWQNFDTGEIGIWRTDNNWNWLSSNVFAPDPVEIATVESLFDINL